MAIEISQSNTNFKMLGKGQIIVILSLTKKAKDTIFVGNKNDTLNALMILLTRKTQWTDYTEEVILIITVRSSQQSHSVQSTASSSRMLTQISFPFRIRDILLSQCNTGYVYMLI